MGPKCTPISAQVGFCNLAFSVFFHGFFHKNRASTLVQYCTKVPSNNWRKDTPLQCPNSRFRLYLSVFGPLVCGLGGLQCVRLWCKLLVNTVVSGVRLPQNTVFPECFAAVLALGSVFAVFSLALAPCTYSLARRKSRKLCGQCRLHMFRQLCRLLFPGFFHTNRA